MAALKEEGLQKLKEQCGNDCKVDVWRGIMTEAFRKKAENWKKHANNSPKSSMGY